MATDVTEILKRLLSVNRGPSKFAPDARQPVDYGVAAALAGDRLEVVITFKKDQAYCCNEWGCHLALPGDKPWSKLRGLFSESGVAAPPSMSLSLLCEIEPGALFFDLTRPAPQRRRLYALTPASGHSYEVFAQESASN